MKRFLIAVAVLLCAAATGSAQDIPLSKILVEGEGWKVAAKDLRGVVFLSGWPNGRVFVGTQQTNHLITTEGKVTPDAPGVEGPVDPLETPLSVERGLYYQLKQSEGVLELRRKTFGTTGIQSVTLQTTRLDRLAKPSCITVWPDGSQLVIGEAGGKYLWTVRIDKEGKLGGVDRYYSLRVKPGEKTSGIKAMVMDAGNLLYAATPLGVQVFDPTGRLSGVILPPAKEEMTAITIGGEKGDTLFVATGDKVYSRKIQGKAVYTLKKDK
jgi:hypothetical protein